MCKEVLSTWKLYKHWILFYTIFSLGMWIENARGPKADSFSTPHLTAVSSVYWDWSTALKCMLETKHLLQYPSFSSGDLSICKHRYEW